MGEQKLAYSREKIKEKNIFKKITRRRAQNSTILTFLLILFKEKKISKNFFSPPPKFLVFVTAFFSTFFLSLQFSHQNPLKIFLSLHLGKEKNFEKKKIKKKRIKKIAHP